MVLLTIRCFHDDLAASDGEANVVSESELLSAEDRRRSPVGILKANSIDFNPHQDLLKGTVDALRAFALVWP
jgi:hypothetical protein